MLLRRYFSFAVLIFAVVSSASAHDVTMQIKILSAESRQFQGPPDVPRDCTWRDISAYCDMSSPKTYIENTMLVQKPDGASVEIGCTIYNRWSRCTDLPVNQNFQARLTKRGLDIKYSDQRGKMRHQLYEILK
jgi:hypothetical protein